jgi:hypothetical protein
VTSLAAEVADLERQLRLLRPCAVLDRVPHCPHTPTPPQLRFLELDTLEGLYGGAAGGGKSDALLMAALQFVDVSGYSALLLRRTFPDLRQSGALMDRLASWLSSSGASWREVDRRWTFPSGATITFGYAESLADIVRAYQGAEYQMIGIDEIGQWREPEYQYLFSRARRIAGSRVPVRMRAAGNPGGIGHAWVKRHFIVPGDPARPFVPARLDDNPHLDREQYERSLDLLDSRTRAQLREGSWEDVTTGRVYWAFLRTRNVRMGLPSVARASWHYVLAIDLGASEEKPTTSFVVLAWSALSRVVYVVRSWTMASGSPQRTSDEIARVRDVYPIERIVVDAGALGAGYLRDFQKRFGESAKAAEKRDKAGARRTINGEMERGNVLLIEGQHTSAEVVGGEVRDLVWELESLRYDKEGLDADPSMPDHLTDALLYGWRECYAWAATLPAPPPTSEERAARVEEELEQARIRALLRDEEEDW